MDVPILANPDIQLAVSYAPIDPRAVCNLILDEGESRGVAFTHLPLQKLLYFAHGTFLLEHKKPLVTGYFEAWQNGPVHPVIYNAFKSAGSDPISFRAHRQHPLTGELHPIARPNDPNVLLTIGNIVNKLGHWSAGRLVKISHARHGPWHFVVEKGRSSVALGLRISDALILERYRYHMISVGTAPATDECLEDTPFA